MWDVSREAACFCVSCRLPPEWGSSGPRPACGSTINRPALQPGPDAATSPISPFSSLAARRPRVQQYAFSLCSVRPILIAASSPLTQPALNGRDRRQDHQGSAVATVAAGYAPYPPKPRSRRRRYGRSLDPPANPARFRKRRLHADDDLRLVRRRFHGKFLKPLCRSSTHLPQLSAGLAALRQHDPRAVSERLAHGGFRAMVRGCSAAFHNFLGFLRVMPWPVMAMWRCSPRRP